MLTLSSSVSNAPTAQLRRRVLPRRARPIAPRFLPLHALGAGDLGLASHSELCLRLHYCVSYCICVSNTVTSYLLLLTEDKQVISK